ncbi:IS66 family transposase [Shewanella sp. YLB-07]|nr:IS66 family transposase [Shewanella sp. YLB-07]
MNHIKKLYRLEIKLKGKPAAEKYQQRQKVAVPLLNTLKEWLDKAVMRISPKTKLGEAISYTLNQWPKLMRYIEDGRLSIDNNRAERTVKPFVVGRKNWMFSNTASGAQASAVLYSIIETAKVNGLMPFDYINHCLTQLAIDPNEVESLLPWNVNLNV